MTGTDPRTSRDPQPAGDPQPGGDTEAGVPAAETPPTVPGERPTRQRRAVAEVLASVDDFRSAQEIHDLVRERGEQVGLATVYRTLQRLADAAEVDVLRTEDGEAVYRRCSLTHHHHLVCRDCGATVEVAGPAVERWTSSIASEHGYTDISHTLELFGTCPDCSTR